MLLYVADNTGRHDIDDIDFRREGLINDLSFFSYLHLNESC